MSSKKIRTAGGLKNSFHVLFQSIFTNQVPVTISYAYIPITRHIRKGVLIRRIISSDLCTAVGSQHSYSESRKLRMRIIFERYYSFFYYCLLSYRYVMLHVYFDIFYVFCVAREISCLLLLLLLQKSILSRPKW